MTLWARSLRPMFGAEAERAAEVHLEALDLVAVVVHDELALEADVGDLGAGAGVGAAVDVDRDLGVEVGEALLQLGHQAARALLGVDDRELAELDAGAGHRRAPPVARAGGEADLLEVVGEGRGVLGGDADDHELLVRRQAGAAGAVLLDEVAERAQRGAVDAADDRRGADVEAAVLLLVDADVVALA